jgi:DNA-binding NtrC family response regulator
MTRGGLIARSPVMREIVRQIRRFAATDANVLITGETGVGKNAVALALHESGPRRREPFVHIDCPSLPRSLLEAELFGHELGAFTDASVARPGRFEQAGRGTVYLDNVSELPPDVQGKLLRVVEDRRVERLGATASIEMPARIISSAGFDLEDSVRRGAFRDDLYHRLRVLPLPIPPLRDRRTDIAPLARHFLQAAARRHARRPLALTPAARAALERYPWPGNVRELHHAIERAVVGIDAARSTLDTSDLPIDILDASEAMFGSAPAEKHRPTLEEVERRYIEIVLREARGNQTRAAAILGISRKALWEKRKKLRRD